MAEEEEEEEEGEKEEEEEEEEEEEKEEEEKEEEEEGEEEEEEEEEGEEEEEEKEEDEYDAQTCALVTWAPAATWATRNWTMMSERVARRWWEWLGCTYSHFLALEWVLLPSPSTMYAIRVH